MSAKQTVRDRPPRVLLVEDDPAIAKMLRFSLRAPQMIETGSLTVPGSHFSIDSLVTAAGAVYHCLR